MATWLIFIPSFFNIKICDCQCVHYWERKFFKGADFYNITRLTYLLLILAIPLFCLTYSSAFCIYKLIIMHFIIFDKHYNKGLYAFCSALCLLILIILIYFLVFIGYSEVRNGTMYEFMNYFMLDFFLFLFFMWLQK